MTEVKEVEREIKVTGLDVDYTLFQERDGKVLTASIVFNDALRINVNKSEVWSLIKTLETIFNNMDSKTDL